MPYYTVNSTGTAAGGGVLAFWHSANLDAPVLGWQERGGVFREIEGAAAQTPRISADGARIAAAAGIFSTEGISIYGTTIRPGERLATTLGGLYPVPSPERVSRSHSGREMRVFTTSRAPDRAQSNNGLTSQLGRPWNCAP